MPHTEQFKSLKTVVCHADCPDGLASAMILKNAIPAAKVVFVQHNTTELAALQATPGMIFCDFCPPEDRYKEFLAAGAIVLDHHKSTKHIVYEFGPNGIFADEKLEPGVSGAMLAFRHVWFPMEMEAHSRCEVHYHIMPDGRCTCMRHRKRIERFAFLAGIRDTWQRQSPNWEEACAQAESLLFWPREMWLNAGIPEWDVLLKIGPTILQKHAARIDRTLMEAFRFTSSKGLKVVMFQGTSGVASDAIDKLGNEADLVVGFSYVCEANEPKVIFRLRSRGNFDCSKFAERHPLGGGHTGAAGFSLKIPVAPGATPYAFLKNLLTIHETTM